MKKTILAGLTLLLCTALPSTAKAEDLEIFAEHLQQQELFVYQAFWYDCSERSGAEPRTTWSYVPADRMHSLFNLSYVPDESGSYWSRGQGRDVECLPRLDTINAEEWGYSVGNAMGTMAWEIDENLRVVDASIMSLSAFGPFTGEQADTANPVIRSTLMVHMAWPDGRIENRILYVNVFSDGSGYTTQ